jgi:putative SOS response-associated peptidase YedK
MCGRFAVIDKFEKIAAYYKARPFGGEEWRENYNVAPTQMIPVIVDEPDGRELRLMRWGLVPFWAKDIKIGASMINARAETVKDKPGFRDSFKERRCIIPASGFFEWKKLTTEKQPYYFSPTEGMFSFAGLWSRWISPDNKEVESCTIITTDANNVVKPIHDRMPVVLGHNSLSVWIEKVTKPAELGELLVPISESQITGYPVTKFVNSVKNNGPDCIVRNSA